MLLFSLVQQFTSFFFSCTLRYTVISLLSSTLCKRAPTQNKMSQLQPLQPSRDSCRTAQCRLYSLPLSQPIFLLPKDVAHMHAHTQSCPAPLSTTAAEKRAVLLLLLCLLEVALSADHASTCCVYKARAREGRDPGCGYGGLALSLHCHVDS